MGNEGVPLGSGAKSGGMLALGDIFFAFQLAVLAYVISCVLMSQGNILEPWLDMLLWVERRGKFGAWIAKPLGLCEKCLAGQLAFWIWIHYNYGRYEVITHITFVAFTILFVITIKHWNGRN